MPDLIAAFNNLIVSQQSAYIAGLIAAFTPCTLAIIPIFLYRFGIWDLKPQAGSSSLRVVVKDVSLLLAGYLISFAVAGFLLQHLLNSQLVNVTRLFLGYTLVLIGILQLGGKLSLQFMNRFSSPLLIGVITPWLISFSPCVLPYFAGLVLTAVSGDTVLKFVLFGLGVLTPALLLSFIGNRLLAAFRKLTHKLAVIERWAAVLIVISGVYVTAELLSVTQADILLTGVLMLALIGLIAYLILKRPSRRTAMNYVMLAVVFAANLLVTGYLTLQASGTVSVTGIALAHACSGNRIDCPFCLTTAIAYLFISGGLAVVFLLSDRKGKRVRFTL